MMAIIVIDAHFEPGRDRLAEYLEHRDRLPSPDPGPLSVDTIAEDQLPDAHEEELESSKGGTTAAVFDQMGASLLQTTDLQIQEARDSR